MVLGRDFTPRDGRNAPRVAILNEAAARKFFPNQNPVELRFGHDAAKTSEIEIIGVARDTKYNQLRESAPAILYEPIAQGPQEAMTFALRTESDPVAMTPSIRDTVRQVDPNLAVLDITTQKQEIEQKFAQERLLAQAYSVFAAIALFLASIGLFALMSYNVSRRTNEIGIRMALGAQSVDVLRMVMNESVVVLAIGLGIGLAASLAARPSDSKCAVRNHSHRSGKHRVGNCDFGDCRDGGCILALIKKKSGRPVCPSPVRQDSNSSAYLKNRVSVSQSRSSKASSNSFFSPCSVFHES